MRCPPFMAVRKRPGSLLAVAALAMTLAQPTAVFAQDAEPYAVDLELVLAVDASGSVDEREYALQMSGIATAFRDQAVQEAIRSGPYGRIAVALLTWAEATEPKDASDWFVVASPEGAERLARFVESFPRRVAGGTGIGQAVAYSVRLFERNDIESLRKVIDVSGDGKETAPRDYTVMPKQARFVATARGITINGLAIQNEVPDLASYYRSHVIAGNEAFALSVDSYEDFTEAMIRKLLREIRYRPKVSALPPRTGARVMSAYRSRSREPDPRCAIGERQIKLASQCRFLDLGKPPK